MKKKFFLLHSWPSSSSLSWPRDEAKVAQACHLHFFIFTKINLRITLLSLKSPPKYERSGLAQLTRCILTSTLRNLVIGRRYGFYIFSGFLVWSSTSGSPHKGVVILWTLWSPGSVAANFSVRDPALLHQFAVSCTLSLCKVPFETKKLCYRKLRSIDIPEMRADIVNSSLVLVEVDDVTVLVDWYNSVLWSLLDKHAPLIERVVTLRPAAPCACVDNWSAIGGVLDWQLIVNFILINAKWLTSSSTSRSWGIYSRTTNQIRRDCSECGC